MTLTQRDQEHVWHPFTQHFTAPAPIAIERGEGAWLYSDDGRKILDAISSWWVTVHGHAHPYIAEAIARQARTLEQVIFAGFTHPEAVRISERIIEVLPEPFNRVFFSDDGSTAVEVGLKMAWQYWYNLGKPRNRILAFEHAYHGDTFGAMSVSGRSIFTKPFGPLLFEVDFLPSPGEVDLETVLAELERVCAEETPAALILEPLVQGAGGMLMYAPETLDAIMEACRERGILVIFDEVMTGFYRTGKLFAMEHLRHTPDIVCLSKGLTGGFLPMSITVCTETIYEAFLSEDRARTLFHGHSYTANPIACAAANASLDLFLQAENQEKIAAICALQAEAVERFRENPYVEKVRVQGTILAMNVKTATGGYLASQGQALGKWFLERDVLLRLLGNVLYVMPPYAIELDVLAKLYDLMEVGLEAIMGSEK